MEKYSAVLCTGWSLLITFNHFAMKNLIKLFVILLIPALALTSCKDDNNDPVLQEFETLTTYMAQNNLDLSNVLDGWVKAANIGLVSETDFSIPGYFVMDIRAQEHFEAGHIKGAVNVAVPDALTVAATTTEPILVVCYTGQTAARVTGLLRLMGYDAYSMKWGMSGWHSDFNSKWASNAGDFSSPNWVFTGDPVPNKEFGEPSINTGAPTGLAILESRVRTALQNTSWGISKTDVLENPANYFLNNMWPITSWDEFGHITGAYRLNEDLSLAGLKYVDPDATVVTYCYTGQTSAIISSWLEVLGYDARSLVFGANSIVHSKLVVSDTDNAKKKSWQGEGSASTNMFEYVTGP